MNEGRNERRNEWSKFSSFLFWKEGMKEGGKEGRNEGTKQISVVIILE